MREAVRLLVFAAVLFIVFVLLDHFAGAGLQLLSNTVQTVVTVVVVLTARFAEKRKSN